MGERRLVRLRFAPLSLLTVGAAAAMIFSIVTSGTTASLTSIAGLTDWPSSYVTGLSCQAASTCTVVGSDGANADSGNFDSTEIGGRWGTQNSILGQGGSANLIGLACSRRGECVATDITGFYVEHDAHWSGDVATRFREFANAPILLAGCSPRGICWVANSDVEIGNSDALSNAYAIGEFDGHLLSPHLLGPLRSPKAVVWNVIANGISCWSTTSCTFTGFVYEGFGAKEFLRRQFVQTESNNRWASAQWIPQTPGADSDGLFELLPFEAPFACTGLGDCLLGGGVRLTRSERILSAVDEETGGHWRSTLIGAEPKKGYSSQISQLACHGVSICVVSGGVDPQVVPNGTLFFRARVDGRWQSPLVMATGKSDSQFGSIARGAVCPTTTTCYVVGAFTSTVGQPLGFVATWKRGRWSFQELDFSPGAADTSFNAVACSRTQCWVSGNTGPFGSTWSEAFVFPLRP